MLTSCEKLQCLPTAHRRGSVFDATMVDSLFEIAANFFVGHYPKFCETSESFTSTKGVTKLGRETCNNEKNNKPERFRGQLQY